MSEYNKTSNFVNWIYFSVGVILLAIIIFWIYSTVFANKPETENVSSTISEPDVVEPEKKPDIQRVSEEIVEPDIPTKVSQELSEPESESEPMPKLPQLNDSDEFIRNQLSELNDSTEFSYWFQSPQLLQRWVTVIDGLSKGNLIRGVVSVETPKSKFPIVKKGERYFLDAKGFDRFTVYVQLIQSVPAEQLADVFHFMRPLLEESYALLGQKPEDFDNVLIRALDNILKAPVYPGEIELLAKTVNYQYADKEIEDLSQLDKLMIRMGPTHTASLQKYARELKSQLL